MIGEGMRDLGVAGTFKYLLVHLSDSTSGLHAAAEFLLASPGATFRVRKK